MSYNHCATPRGEEEHIRDGESCQICKDWIKAGRPATTSATKPAKPKRDKAKGKKQSKAECGTRAGYLRHRSNGEESCNPCREAHSAYNRREKTVTREVVREHGTLKGWNQHRYRNETPCQLCKTAKTIDSKKYKTRKKTGDVRPMKKRETVRVHGSMKGARQHHYFGDPMCDPCAEAQRTYTHERHNARRAAQGLPPVQRRDERVHGSTAGAQQHRKHGEPVCDDCRQAERREKAEYRRNQRQVAA